MASKDDNLKKNKLFLHFLKKIFGQFSLFVVPLHAFSACERDDGAIARINNSRAPRNIKSNKIN